MIYLKVKTVFLCLTVILICSLIYSTLVERLSAGNVFVLLIAATLCGVLTHIERLESFSASLTGVKATLTKLNESIETAETLIALLRKLQLTYAKAVFSIVQDKDVAAPHDFRSLKQRDAIKAMVIHEAEKGVRHRTGRIARFVARIGNVIRQPWLRAIWLPYCAVA
jgi:hypothetical protein